MRLDAHGIIDEGGSYEKNHSLLRVGDNDGRIDVVVLNSRSAPTVLRNESAAGNHWIQIQLRGVKTNRDGADVLDRPAVDSLLTITERTVPPH
jgi:hypothetical protein